MIPLLVAAVVAALPVEYVVDCSLPPPRIPGREAEFEFSFRYECWNGDTVGDKGAASFGVSGEQVTEAFSLQLRRSGWRVEMVGPPGGQTVFVVRRSKASPIKSVRFDGGWSPVVTRRLALPPPQK